MNKTGTVNLETPRLLLRRFTIDDAQGMFDNWSSDPEVTRYLTWPVHANVDVTQRVIKSWIKGYEEESCFNWVIEYKGTQKVIGSIAVVKLDEVVKSAEVGYCLGKTYWGKGIMTEALKVVMDHLFDVVGLNRVAAYHDIHNPASGRVMEKAGMKFEGILRQSHRNNTGIHDTVWHAMIRSDRGKNPLQQN